MPRARTLGRWNLGEAAADSGRAVQLPSDRDWVIKEEPPGGGSRPAMIVATWATAELVTHPPMPYGCRRRSGGCLRLAKELVRPTPGALQGLRGRATP